MTIARLQFVERNFQHRVGFDFEIAAMLTKGFFKKCSVSFAISISVSPLYALPIVFNSPLLSSRTAKYSRSETLLRLPWPYSAPTTTQSSVANAFFQLKPGKPAPARRVKTARLLYHQAFIVAGSGRH